MPLIMPGHHIALIVEDLERATAELVDMGRSGPGLCRHLAGGDSGPVPTPATEHGS